MNLLGNALIEAELVTLDELASHHPFGSFRPRALGLLALNDGEPVVLIARILRVHTETVYRWARGWREQGLVGILGGHEGGRSRSLSIELLDEAAKIAQETPLTLRNILNRLGEAHPDINTAADVRPLSRGLRERGLSFKRTRLSLKKKRDMTRFDVARDSLKTMKDWAKTGEIGLYYVDESGFSNLPEVQRAWSPLGVPHTADATVGRARTNVLGALDFGAKKLLFATHSHSIKEVDVIAFLDQLAIEAPANRWNICVLDNASIHRHIDEATCSRLFHAGLILYFIPAYSPELNLIEILWKHAKYHWREFATWPAKKLQDSVHSLLNSFGKKFNTCFG
jgi:transposase